MPLPGAVGAADATIYHVEIANIATLELNSPVMINDVVVDSVGDITVKGLARDRRRVRQLTSPGLPMRSQVLGQTSLAPCIWH